MLARAGARFQERLDPRVLGAILIRAGRAPQARAAPATGLADLEAMQRFASGPGPFAFFDAPWTPVFLFAYCFSSTGCWASWRCSAGVLLFALALMNQWRTARLQAEAGAASAHAFQLTEQMRAGGETVRGLGMRASALERLAAIRGRALAAAIAVSDRGGAFAATTRTLRLFLQSMMLGLGAWLAIQGTITAGIMIAASILLGRALAPIDQAVAQWPVLQRALEGRRALAELLAQTPEAPEPGLPFPRRIRRRWRGPGGRCWRPNGSSWERRGRRQPAVRRRVVPSSTRAGRSASRGPRPRASRRWRGRWPGCGLPLAGRVTLAGAALEQYGETALAGHIGWLPQEVVLFPGTVAENIARLAPEPDARSGGEGRAPRRRPRDDPRPAGTATASRCRPAARRCPAASASGSRLRAPSSGIRRWWCSTSRMRISTTRASRALHRAIGALTAAGAGGRDRCPQSAHAACLRRGHDHAGRGSCTRPGCEPVPAGQPSGGGVRSGTGAGPRVVALKAPPPWLGGRPKDAPE